MAANLQKFSNLSLKRKKCLQICRHFCMDRRVFKRQKDYTRPALFFRYLQLHAMAVVYELRFITLGQPRGFDGGKPFVTVCIKWVECVNVN